MSKHHLRENTIRAMYHKSSGQHSSMAETSGFTILELLVVVVMVGILSAITAPGYLAWRNRQAIASANEAAYSAIRLAQATAIRDRRNYQASFRMFEGQAEVAVHPIPPDPSTNDIVDTLESGVAWETLSDVVAIDTTVGNTTFADAFMDTDGDSTVDTEVYWVYFDFEGNPNNTGRITFSYLLPDSTFSSVKRCTFISTLIGGLRQDTDNGCT